MGGGGSRRRPGAKALLCADVPLTLMVNGHPVLADESENVMVRSSFTQLKERGYLLAWRNATFACAPSGLNGWGGG